MIGLLCGLENGCLSGAALTASCSLGVCTYVIVALAVLGVYVCM